VPPEASSARLLVNSCAWRLDAESVELCVCNMQQMMVVLVQAAVHNGDSTHTAGATKKALPFDSHPVRECRQVWGKPFMLQLCRKLQCYL
jgi:hypothetical protein